MGMSMDRGSIVRGRMHEHGPSYPPQYVPPGGVPTVDAEPLTGEQIERLRAKFERAARKPPKLLTPLPRRTRLRLAVTHAIDGIGIWLVNGGHAAAAGRLWRIAGRWTG